MDLQVKKVKADISLTGHCHQPQTETTDLFPPVRGED